MEDYLDKIKELLETESWITEFLLAQGYCVICGHDDPLDIEFHHVGRKRNSDVVISVCRNCHGRFSRQQRWWPKASLKRNNPPDLRVALFYKGMSEILAEKARRIFEKYGVWDY